MAKNLVRIIRPRRFQSLRVYHHDGHVFVNECFFVIVGRTARFKVEGGILDDKFLMFVLADDEFLDDLSVDANVPAMALIGIELEWRIPMS